MVLERGQSSVIPVAIGVAVLGLVTLVADPSLTGDGPYYVADVLSRFDQGTSGWKHWDAGHLLWRPLLFGLAWIVGATGLSVVDHSLVASIATACSWTGTLLCLLFLPLWLERVRIGAPAIVTATVAAIVSNVSLIYFQGGSSYHPSLALLFMGLFLHAGNASRRSAVLAGLAFAGAVLLWLPFVLALPAALGAPALLSPGRRGTAPRIAIATASCACAGLVAYGSVAAHLDILSVGRFTAWVNDASHGITHVGGASRAVFGLARSSLDMGTDGAMLKRYLLRDPYNPVTVLDLLGASVGKLAFFYVVMTGIAAGIWMRRKGTFPWLFCTVNALPVLAFAVMWQGGDPERYLPMYPAILLAIGYAADGLSSGTSRGRWLVYTFILACTVINVPARSKRAAAIRERDARARIEGMPSAALPANSALFTPSSYDGLAAYVAIGRARDIPALTNSRVYGLLSPGVEQSPRWRELFAERAQGVWKAGGRVWIARRLLSATPRAEWGWVEGDDPRLKWADFPRYFARLELGQAFSGDDGFVEVVPTARNRSLLAGDMAETRLQ